MKERLANHIARSSVISIVTEVNGEESRYYGVPIRLSSSLLTLHDVSDFHFNGFQTVRVRDIVKVKRGRFEIICEKILTTNGETENHKVPTWLRVGSWKSLLASLKRKGYCACVESTLMEVDVFFIGDIYSLTDKAVVLRSFGADGKWHNSRTDIEYRHITAIGFGDEYSVLFRDYMKQAVGHLYGAEM